MNVFDNDIFLDSKDALDTEDETYKMNVNIESKRFSISDEKKILSHQGGV